MQSFADPFPHFLLDDFLSPPQFKKACQLYATLKFEEKESDLFEFLQTQELAHEQGVSFFLRALRKPLGQLCSLEGTYFNLFASYYREGDYLLCHDDVVEDRRFAFSYYLNDHDSAPLVLFDESATKPVTQFAVKANRLVIFEVSNISYHEVAMSAQAGRRAFTGWLNTPGHGSSRQPKVTLPYQPRLPAHYASFPLPGGLNDEEYSCFPGIEYDFAGGQTEEAGPHFERKAQRLTLRRPVVLQLPGYQLLSADFLRFKKGGYLLLNDPVNSLEGDLLDVFIMGKVREEGPLLTVIGEDGSIEGHVPYANQTMFVIRRGRKNYCLPPAPHPVQLAHLIYQRTQHKTPKTPKPTTLPVQQQSKGQMDSNGRQTKAAKAKGQKPKVGEWEGGEIKGVVGGSRGVGGRGGQGGLVKRKLIRKKGV